MYMRALREYCYSCDSICVVLLRGAVVLFVFFFFNDTATTEIYTLSLHDALPISVLHLVMCSLLVSVVGAVLGSAGMHHLMHWPWQPMMAMWFSSELMHMTLLLPVLLSLPAKLEPLSWRSQPFKQTAQALLPLLALAISESDRKSVV